MKDLKLLVSQIIEGEFNNGRNTDKICRHYLSKFLTNSHDIDEVMQTSYLKAIDGSGTYDCSREFMPWFITIVKNTCIDFLSKKDIRREVLVGDLLNQAPDYFVNQDSNLGEFIDEITSKKDGGDISQILGEREELNTKTTMLYESFTKLTRKQLRVLSQYEYMGLEYKEIASINKTPIGTVRSQLSSARNALARKVFTRSFNADKKREQNALCR